MIFHRNDVTPSRPLDVEEAYDDFEVGEKAYPLLQIKKAKLVATIRKIDGILRVSGKLDAALVLSDARSLRPVDYKLDRDVDFDLLSSEEEEGDGYVFPENKIDLKEVAYCLILTLMPKSYSKEKDLPSSGEGYVVYSEGSEEGASSPFASLNPDDFA